MLIGQDGHYYCAAHGGVQILDAAGYTIGSGGINRDSTYERTNIECFTCLRVIHFEGKGFDFLTVLLFVLFFGRCTRMD